MSEFRKVQRTPTGTFFVCLPRSWAEQQGLEKGSLVALTETGEGKILIDPNYDAKPQPKVSLLAPGPFLDREILSRYLSGYDTIRIEAKDLVDSDVRARVKAALGLVIGLGIVGETASQIVLQCWLDPCDFPPEKILQQITAIVTGMYRDAVESLLGGDVQLARSVVARDDDSDRLYFLLVRILRTAIQDPRLSEKLGITPLSCMDYRLAAKMVEAVGDASAEAAVKTIDLNGVKPTEEVRNVLVNLQAVCSDAYEQSLKAFLNGDVAVAENVRNLRDRVRTLTADVEKVTKNQPAEVVPLAFVASFLMRQVYECSVDLADLVP